MELPFAQPILHGLMPPIWEARELAKIRHVATGKWLVLTPEEWVRQNLLLHLAAIGYPLSLIATERLVKVGKIRRRYDVVVYLPNLSPYMIAECKAPEKPVTIKTHMQAAEYNTDLKAEFILLTNGIDYHVFRQTGIAHERLNSIPAFPQALESNS